MHRIPTRKRRQIEIAILAAILAVHAATVTVRVFHDRTVAQVNAVLNDPLTSAITPSQFGLEVASEKPTRSGDDKWKTYCYEARASMIEQARSSSEAIAKN